MPDRPVKDVVKELLEMMENHLDKDEIKKFDEIKSLLEKEN